MKLKINSLWDRYIEDDTESSLPFISMSEIKNTLSEKEFYDFSLKFFALAYLLHIKNEDLKLLEESLISFGTYAVPMGNGWVMAHNMSSYEEAVDYVIKNTKKVSL